MFQPLKLADVIDMTGKVSTSVLFNRLTDRRPHGVQLMAPMKAGTLTDKLKARIDDRGFVIPDVVLSGLPRNAVPRRQLKRTSQVVLAAAVGAVVAAQPVRALTLVEDGDPKATIVLAEKPTGSAQLAAYELRHYLRKISGATLPMVREPADVTGNRILVGESKATLELGIANPEFQEQEYTIRTLPEALVLAGYDRQYFEEVRYEDAGEFNSLYNASLGMIGTCYAVHDFLENTLGVRWYYPNEEIGEVVPVASAIEVKDLHVRRSPDAPIRNVYPLYTNSEKLYFTDWDERRNFQSSWVNPRTSLLYWIRNRHWGGMRHNANHSFDSYGAAFGESHPEWFSTKSYAKMQQLDYQMGVQPCFSAPGFFEHVVQTARDYFDGKPDPFPRAYWAAVGNFFPIVPNDNTNMCACDACRLQYSSDYGPIGNASHYVWGFINRIAREVRKTHPDAMTSGLAYFNYTVPPKGLVFEPNVAVEFCKFYTYYADHNYQQQDYRRIAEYVNENKAKFFTTWEYQMKPDIAEWAFPCMVPHVHADDVQHLRNIGGFMGGKNQFLYLTTYIGTTPGGVAQVSPVLDFMNLYWRLKLYDNFDFDLDKGLTEYYRKFFGPGAEGMAKFYTAMENRWKTLGGGVESRAWWGKMGTPEFLEEIGGYIEQARQATGDGTIYRKRVELIDAGILKHMLKARAKYEKSAISEFAPVGTTAVARTDVTATADWTSDATWADAMPNRIEKTLANEPAPQKTTFKLAYDDRNLYLYVRCLEPGVSQMKAATHDKDIGGFSDDSIELFFDPEGRGETFYQFCINSLGAVYDALVDPYAIGATDTTTWDSGTKVMAKTGEDHWELRMAVPFVAFVNEPPAAGSTWRFNLCRNRWAEPDKPPYSAWSPTPAGFQEPQQFGIITFNAPEDRGLVLWHCDFDSAAFANESGESPLIGLDGWYENPSYANKGWGKSWTVLNRRDNPLAVCDVNETNPSDLVPMHAVGVLPGVVSVEVDYRRLSTEGNMPTLFVTDVNAKYIGYFYVSDGSHDVATLDVPDNRQSYGNNEHGLGSFSDPGKWFSLKMVIDTVQRNVIGYLRNGSGRWVRLDETPLPYYDSQADGTDLLVGFGTYKRGSAKSNILEMDNIRVTQLSHQSLD
jgi:hypothetical protein